MSTLRTFCLFMLVIAAFASGIVLERYGVIASAALPGSSPQLASSSAASPAGAAATQEHAAEALADLSEVQVNPNPFTLQKEIQKRAAYLASLVDEVKRLDRHSGAVAGKDVYSERQRGRGKKPAMGGGEGRSHAYYKMGGRFEDISFHERAVSNRSKVLVKLSPLLGIDADLAKFASTPVGAPVIGEVTSGFGFRDSPFDVGRRLHEGIDFAVEARTPVSATADGVVTSAEYKSGYGNTIVIQHKDGIETLYAHLSRMSVKVGSRVCRGQRIGLVGTSGHSTGPHVHYEVRVNGVPHNPMRFVRLGSLVTALADLPEEGPASIG